MEREHEKRLYEARLSRSNLLVSCVVEMPTNNKTVGIQQLRNNIMKYQ